MRLLWLAGAALFTAPVSAQDHASHGTEQAEEGDGTVDHCAMGHLPPDQCPPNDGQEEHAGMDHSMHAMSEEDDAGQADLDHSTMDHTTMDHSQHGAGIDRSVPGAAPESAIPPRAFDGPRHAADEIWGADSMVSSRDHLARENGGMRTGMVMIERLEARIPTDGGDTGYVWDAQAFYGGDINRFVLKTEGEGEFGGDLEDAEIQALYSRAIGPFFDLQAGVRFDPEPDTRSHLVVGIQGLAPYMFHLDGAVFLSDRGDLMGRIEGEYDQRITQQLILQPRIEVELAAQDIPERGLGTGITKLEAGARLRYEFEREFAPYVGIEYEARLGETADIARAAGDSADSVKVLVGLRVWF